ncbi:hypothetical protein FS815_24510 [Agrobacterium vitis]|uniref:hypothetical protein n=1 Tax=Allorhizobium ampelinum TaxID=3025782 RepID=UPI001F19EC1B|nr:hypothetical protein [Allorhizobium ampelinum]MCF1449956.1 hypothetical protein [Allorhizobium ampelinum]
MNIHSADERQRLMLSCCLRSVQASFSHIALRDIIDPPREMLDALLARQIALTLLRDEFNVPARRVAIMVNRNRGRIAFAMWTVTSRRECPIFDQAYGLMLKRARSIFNYELRRRSVSEAA